MDTAAMSPGLESNRACSAKRLSLVAQTEPEQPNRLLGRTEPSPSDRVMPPSKPNRACKPPSRARADPLLSLLGLIPGLHVTVDFINHCCQHKILLLRLIPHTLHLC